MQGTKRTGYRLNGAGVLVWLTILAFSGAGAAATAEVGAQTPHREVFWGVERAGWTVYPLLAVLVATLLYLPFRRSALWRLGRPVAISGPFGERLRHLMQGSVQHRVPRDPYAGVYHLCIYSSIIALTIVTLVLALDHEIWQPLTGQPFLQGPVYLGYKAFSTIFGVLGLVGVGMA